MTATLYLDKDDQFDRLESFDAHPTFYVGLPKGSSLALAVNARTLDAAKRFRDELTAGIASLEAHLATLAVKEGA